MKILFINLIIFLTISNAIADHYHPRPQKSRKLTDAEPFLLFPEREQTTEYWFSQAQVKLSQLLQQKENTNKAKNVIMFLGDGMSIVTVATARMYLGGEEKELFFEKFPHYGLSKTYCVDTQVADSACTSTAYLNGIKTNYKIIGLNAQAKVNDCEAQLNRDLHTESILRWAQKTCKATGIVTNTRITHASPAGAYAHIGHRDWENDNEIEISKCDKDKLDDIAEQLVYNTEGKNFNVILGGGRGNFRDSEKEDEEDQKGYRNDKRDLVQEWLSERGKSGNAKFVWNRKDLMNLSISETDYVLGLFEGGHMKYNMDANPETEPTLAEMTEIAIKMLQKREEGFFLFVEGGMIDQAHHYNYAQVALNETIEFAKAVEVARKMTSEEDTLIIVTADHAHVNTYNGYPWRGTSLFSATRLGEDRLPYSTLSYANGPGFNNSFNADGSRSNYAEFPFENHKFQYPTGVPLEKETHGGDDVSVYASGPMSHLFTGHYEQNNIPLLMAYAMKIGPYNETELCSSSQAIVPITVLSVLMIFITKIFN